jgi:hypothetical protein
MVLVVLIQKYTLETHLGLNKSTRQTCERQESAEHSGSVSIFDYDGLDSGCVVSKGAAASPIRALRCDQ